MKVSKVNINLNLNKNLNSITNKNTTPFSLQKYINKLKVGKCPAYLIGQDNGLGLKNVYHPAYDRTELVPKEVQIAEFYGKMKDNHIYMNEEYKTLLLDLKDIDNKYCEAKTLENRVKLCNNAITAWKGFIEHTKQNLPSEEYTIRDDIMAKLKDIFMRFKKRNKQTIPAEEILPFHNEFAKYYTFDFPVHPKNLAMVLNPHWGYLCKFTKHEFTFENLIDFYKAEYASSYFRNNGRDVLANRVTAFSFWNIIDKDLKGFITFNELVYLLESVAFDVDNLTQDNIMKNYPTAFAFLQNELLDNEKTNIFRFRLFEYLFMERSAIY